MNKDYTTLINNADSWHNFGDCCEYKYVLEYNRNKKMFIKHGRTTEWKSFVNTINDFWDQIDKMVTCNSENGEEYYEIAGNKTVVCEDGKYMFHRKDRVYPNCPTKNCITIDVHDKDWKQTAYRTIGMSRWMTIRYHEVLGEKNPIFPEHFKINSVYEEETIHEANGFELPF